VAIESVISLPALTNNVAEKRLIPCPVKLSRSGSPRNETTFEKAFEIVFTLIGYVVHFLSTYLKKNLPLTEKASSIIVVKLLEMFVFVFGMRTWK